LDTCPANVASDFGGPLACRFSSTKLSNLIEGLCSCLVPSGWLVYGKLASCKGLLLRCANSHKELRVVISFTSSVSSYVVQVSWLMLEIRISFFLICPWIFFFRRTVTTNLIYNVIKIKIALINIQHWTLCLQTGSQRGTCKCTFSKAFLNDSEKKLWDYVEKFSTYWKVCNSDV
jgi:hypothetical protein